MDRSSAAAEAPDVAIRSAMVADVVAVLELWAGAGGEPTPTDTKAGVEELLARDPGALLVAEREGALVGSVIAAWDGWRGSFYRLAVHPGERRRGIALALVRAGEERLRALGAVRLTAIVDDERDVAMAFWQAAGYSRQRNRARFVARVSAKAS
jgi:ribosomal protein S18 acetylase RimI-like enzyme